MNNTRNRHSLIQSANISRRKTTVTRIRRYLELNSIIFLQLTGADDVADVAKTSALLEVATMSTELTLPPRGTGAE